MAIVEYWIGGQGPFLADTVLDADLLAHGGQVVRFDDLTTIAPASSVVSETTFGLSAAVGSSAHYAREDHSHGSPSDPLVSGLTTTITVVVGPLITNTKALTFTNGKLTEVV